jgi:hypothetical protein
MQLAEALRILGGLADGLDPLTGQPLAADHLCQQPSVVRALCLLVQHLQQAVPSNASAGTNTHGAGIPWTAAEGMELGWAGDFAGTWIMNANGWTFTLKLEVTDGAVTGTMQGINNNQTSAVKGQIKGKGITFRRDHFQEYFGYLLVDDPTGKTNELTIAGIFKSGGDQAGWYAKR